MFGALAAANYTHECGWYEVGLLLSCTRQKSVKFHIVQLPLTALGALLAVKHATVMLLLPQLSAQVRQTKMFGLPLQIYADGHCAALRLRDMLSSDSTVLAMTSLEEMWYTGLIIPWQHVVPVV